MPSLFKKYSELIYFILVLLCCATSLWGNFLVTMAAILLAAFWVLDGNYKQSFKTLWSRKAALCLLIIPVIIILRTLVQLPNPTALMFISKYLPFLIFVFVIGSKPNFSSRQFHAIMLVYIFSVVINSLFCTGNYILTFENGDNFRTISYFISYIRLTLFVLVAISACAFYLFQKKDEVQKNERIFLWCSFIWLSFFIIFLKSFTGYVIFCISAALTLFYLMHKNKKEWAKFLMIALILVGIGIVITAVYSEAKHFIYPDVQPSELEQTTPYGNSYTHIQSYEIENGHYTGLYICESELAEAWAERTNTSVYHLNEHGYSYYSTLVRYMTSKNLRKDKNGFSELSDYEIEAVRNGFTNYRFLSNSNPKKRIYEVCWDLYMYSNGASPENHSIPQRFEFVKCTFQTVERSPFFGFGATVRNEMNQTYQERNNLSSEHWNLPHNQYLLMMLFCGFIGLFLFIFSICGTFWFSKPHWNFLTIGWFIIVVISCFSEDTFNTSAGQACCCLIGSILLFTQPSKKCNPDEQ